MRFNAREQSAMKEFSPYHWAILSMFLPYYSIPAMPLFVILAGFAAIS
jgi:hypothetical protein